MTVQKLTLGLFMSMCMLTSNVLKADLIEQGIKNSDPFFPANDLFLVFSDVVTQVAVTDMKKKTKGIKAGDPGQLTFYFAVGKLPSDIKPGEAAGITFEGPADTTIEKSKSYWTDGGEKIAGALASLGAAPTLSFTATGAFAQFTNPEPITLVYTNIQLYTNNNLTNFDLADFLTPAGQLVTGIPSSIVLNSGESMLLSFGPILSNTYQLALADAAPLSNPGDIYSVGAAAAVPEPATVTLLSLGCLVMITSRKRSLKLMRTQKDHAGAA